LSGSGAGAGERGALAGGESCGPVRGWSGCCGGRAAGGFEEIAPGVLAVPAFGQVEGEAVPAVSGGAGGDGDQVAADGGGAGLGVAPAGEGAGGAQQVVGDGGDGEPGCVGAELSRGQVREGSVVQVGEELSGNGVAAVLFLGLDQLVWAVGEDGVVAPGGEQLALTGCGLPLVAYPADDEPGGDLQFLRLG
jgi:hypothetical protein